MNTNINSSIYKIFMEGYSIDTSSIEFYLLTYNLYLHYGTLCTLSNEKMKEVLTSPRNILHVYRNSIIHSLGLPPNTTTWDYKNKYTEEYLYGIEKYIAKCKKFLLKQSMVY